MAPTTFDPTSLVETFLGNGGLAGGHLGTLTALALRAEAAGRIKPGDDEFPGGSAAEYLAGRLRAEVPLSAETEPSASILRAARTAVDWHGIAERLLAAKRESV